MIAKVRPDTYNAWLRRVRSGRCDFGLSMPAYVAYGAGFRLWVWPDAQKEWLRRIRNGHSYVRLYKIWFAYGGSLLDRASKTT